MSPMHCARHLGLREPERRSPCPGRALAEGKGSHTSKIWRRHLEAADKEELLVVRVQAVNMRRPLLLSEQCGSSSPRLSGLEGSLENIQGIGI